MAATDSVTKMTGSFKASVRTRVSTAREVNIGMHEFAPRGDIPSLDFDRVVNSYSIEATKRRLLKRCRLYNDDSNNVEWSRLSYHSFHKKAEEERQAQEGQTRRLLNVPYGRTLMQWILIITIGLLCGLLAIFIVYCVEIIAAFRVNRLNMGMRVIAGTATDEEYKQKIRFHAIMQAPLAWSVTRSLASEFVISSFYNAFLVFISAAMCLYWAPDAIGSGIPEVKAYLNGSRVPSFANFNILVTKIFGTIFSVSSGLVVGPEGPLVHIGAIIAQALTKTTPVDIALRRFRSKYPKLSGWCGCSRYSLVEGSMDDNESTRKLNAQPTKIKGRMSKPPLKSRSPRAMVGEEESLLASVRENESLVDEELGNLHGSMLMESYLDGSATNGSAKDKGGWTFVSKTVALLSRFRNDRDRRDLISIGAATGFAAAFGAPVGGLLYSIEEASSFYTIRLMWGTLLATTIGTFVIAIYHGNLSDFSILSLGDTPAASLASVTAGFNQIFFYVVIGFGGGILGAAFNSIFCLMSNVRSRFYSLRPQRSGLFKLLDVVLVSLVTSTATFAASFLLPESWVCTDVQSLTPDAAAELKEGELQFNCQPGHFNEVATILLASRDDALNAIFNDPSQFEARTLFLCGSILFGLMLITFGTPIPSGLFMPTLLTGSIFGGWAGIMIQRFLVEDTNPAHMALLGATSMLAGIQRTTVSLCVIMMEATGQVKVLLPLIISVNVARYIADCFNEGFYHIIMHSKHYPFLEHYIKQSFDIPTVSDVMTSPVITIREIETAGTVETLLKENDVSCFPVVNPETKEYVGLIRRDQLVALLECGIYVESRGEGSTRKSIIRRAMRRADRDEVSHALIGDDDIYTRSGRTTAKLINTQSEWLGDNVLGAKSKGLVVTGADETMPEGSFHVLQTVVSFDSEGNLVVNLNSEERGKHINVSDGMNRGAYAVVQNTPLSKAYGLFTALGLRSLPVLGNGGSVVGVITRSNLRADYMEGRTGLQMH